MLNKLGYRGHEHSSSGINRQWEFMGITPNPDDDIVVSNITKTNLSEGTIVHQARMRLRLGIILHLEPGQAWPTEELRERSEKTLEPGSVIGVEKLKLKLLGQGKREILKSRVYGDITPLAKDTFLKE